MLIRPTTVNVQQVAASGPDVQLRPRGQPETSNVGGKQKTVASGQTGKTGAGNALKSDQKPAGTASRAKNSMQMTALNQVVADRIAKFTQSMQRDLVFSVDKTLGETVIKVVDSNTQEVIRQIPSEDALALSRHLKEMGMLFSSKA